MLLVGASGFSRGEPQIEGARVSASTHRLNPMIGAAVQLRAGGPVGRVKDFVIAKDGNIEFVVVAFRERFILVPFNVIVLDFPNRVVIVDADRDRFFRFRTISDIAEVRTLSPFLRASITLRESVAFGRAEDLVIDDRGRVDFVAVADNDRLFFVPFRFAREDLARRAVSFDVDRERVMHSPSFARDRFPNVAPHSETMRQLHTFWSQGERPAKPHSPSPRPAERRPGGNSDG
jgi:hypothetical protein